MQRKYLVLFMGYLLVGVLAFSLQAHAPSWKDFFGWLWLLCLLVGALALVFSLVLLPGGGRKFGRELLIIATLLKFSGGF